MLTQYLRHYAYIAVLCVQFTYFNHAAGGPVVHRLTGESGTIQSPNYPKDYGNNVDIKWELTAKPGYKFIIYFTEFDIEESYDDGQYCAYDYVKLSSKGEIIENLCGSSSLRNPHAPVLEKQIESLDHKLTIHFVADYSNEDPKPKGFFAHYKRVDRDECQELELERLFAYEDWDKLIYCNQKCHNVPGNYFCTCEDGFHLHKNNHTCTNKCQRITLTDDTGTITTSKYPVEYSKLANCDWTIKGKEGISIEFRFVDTFSIERHFEEGCVYDWVQYELGDGKRSEKYCGTGKPNSGNWINTNSYSVKILFHSDLTQEEAGFKVEYRFKRVRCNKMLNAPINGHILSSKSAEYVFEDVIEFSCKKGYRIIGSKSAMCQNNGKWSGVTPVCQAIVCDHPKEFTGIKHASSVVLPSSFAYGAVFTVSCNGEYFEMTSGAASWICGDDAKWVPNSEILAPNDNNNIPECKPACGLKGNARRLSLNTFRKRRAVPRPFGLPGLSKQIPVLPTKFNQVAIVRGKPAKYGEWPWMALVDLYGFGVDTNEFCGGSLISARTVVTAAHCTTKTYKQKMNIYLGVSERTIANDIYIQKFKAAELYEHKDFSDSNFDNDIAVIILDRSAVIGKYVRPVCLPRTAGEQSLPQYALSTDANSKFSKTGVIAGWGITETGYLSRELNFARIPPIEEKKCKKLYEANKPPGDAIKITENMICAGFPGEGGKGRDSCQGDSGGPLMFKEPMSSKFYLNGIVSFGSTEECGKGTFGIYTKVSKYIKWIDNFIRE